MPDNDKTIKMWRFEDAPEELRKLSTAGGDEDWLILIPPGFFGDPVRESIEGLFGWPSYPDPDIKDLPDGSRVLILVH